MEAVGIFDLDTWKGVMQEPGICKCQLQPAYCASTALRRAEL